MAKEAGRYMQEECDWVYVVIITVYRIQYTNLAKNKTFIDFAFYVRFCVQWARKVDNAELPRPTVGEKTQQKNINLFLRAYLGNHAS